MPLFAQILQILALAAALSGVLVTFSGLPAVELPPAAQASAACTPPEQEAASQIHWISQEEARALVDDMSVAFVDCRPRERFEAGHVSGSLHVPAERANVDPAILSRLRAASTVITYCNAEPDCERSLRMATLFQQAGLPDVRILEGGMPQWLRNGYPAQSGTAPVDP